MSNKKTALFFLIIAILMILFFTFQNPEQSRDLSEAVRSWLGRIGIDVEYEYLVEHLTKDVSVGKYVEAIRGL